MTLAKFAPLAALGAAQVAYGMAPRRSAAATRAIVAGMLGTSLAEAVRTRGRRRGLAPVVTAGALGFAAEIVGTQTGRPFGRYAYTDRLGPRVRGVPLLVFAAWSMMARPAWVTAGWLEPRTPRRVVLAAGALTAWDVMLDPRMVRGGYWEWPGGGRYEGIPASNFAGWFATGLVVFVAYAALDRDPVDADDDAALALYLWICGGESFANAALWDAPITAAAGGTAMGAFAVPALARRMRS